MLAQREAHTAALGCTLLLRIGPMMRVVDVVKHEMPSKGNNGGGGGGSPGGGSEGGTAGDSTSRWPVHLGSTWKANVVPVVTSSEDKKSGACSVCIVASATTELLLGSSSTTLTTVSSLKMCTAAGSMLCSKLATAMRHSIRVLYRAVPVAGGALTTAVACVPGDGGDPGGGP